jgi:hypothetical protein
MTQTAPASKSPWQDSQQVPSGLALFITICRQSVENWFHQHGALPPGLFKTEIGLRNWAQANGLVVSPIKGLKQNDALMLQTKSSSLFLYEGVWVRAGSEMYRAAMCAHSQSLASDETAAALRHLDADHVINRANVEYLYGKDWPHTWIYLFPAFGSPNRSFGTLEKKKIVYQVADSIQIQPVHLFKMYVTRAPKSQKQMKLALAVLNGQLVEGTQGQKQQLIQDARKAYEAIRPLP